MTQFNEINRGYITWEYLKKAVNELTEEQLKAPVVLVDYQTQTTVYPIELIVLSEIEDNELVSEIEECHDFYECDLPLIIF